MCATMGIRNQHRKSLYIPTEITYAQALAAARHIQHHPATAEQTILDTASRHTGTIVDEERDEATFYTISPAPPEQLLQTLRPSALQPHIEQIKIPRTTGIASLPVELNNTKDNHGYFTLTSDAPPLRKGDAILSVITDDLHWHTNWINGGPTDHSTTNIKIVCPAETQKLGLTVHQDTHPDGTHKGYPIVTAIQILQPPHQTPPAVQNSIRVGDKIVSCNRKSLLDKDGPVIIQTSLAHNRDCTLIFQRQRRKPQTRKVSSLLAKHLHTELNILRTGHWCRRPANSPEEDPQIISRTTAASMVAAHEALSLRVTALDGRGVLTSGVYGLVPPGLPDSSTHPSTFRYLGLQTSAIDGQNVHNSKILRQYAGRAKAIAQQSHDAQQLKHLLRTDLPGAVDYFSTITYLQPCTLRESSRAIARNALPALGLANFQRKYPDPTTTETLLISPTELTGGLHLAMPLRATQLLKSQTAILRLAHIRHDMGHALLINGLAEPKDDIARLNTNGNHLHALRGSGLLLHSREADSEAQALRRRTHADADPPPHPGHIRRHR